MSLEDKIKMILEGKKDDEKVFGKDAEDDGKDDEQDDHAEPDADDNGGKSDDDEDDEKDDSGDTDLSKDSTKKDKATVKEATTVPGSPDLEGKKVKETLTAKPDEISGASKTSKTVAKYKTNIQGKLDDASGKGSSDEKATSETSKIKSAYSTSSMPKLKMEAFEALFAGESLTEEFKVKAEAIFEAAVEQVAEAKIAVLQEEYQEQLTEAIDEVKGELVEQIDGYLDHIVEKWMEDNAVALESGIKVEMVSSFMEKMKEVFTEHYIDVPESKLDVVAEQAAQIADMQEELATQKELAEQAIAEAKILKCDAIVASISEGLTAIESEKLYSLAENVEFDTEEEFGTKVKALKESYFRKGAAKITTQDTTPATKMNESHSDVAAVMKVLHASKDGQLKVIRSSN